MPGTRLGSGGGGPGGVIQCHPRHLAADLPTNARAYGVPLLGGIAGKGTVLSAMTSRRYADRHASLDSTAFTGGLTGGDISWRTTAELATFKLLVFIASLCR